MVTVCQKCGDKGFGELLDYCHRCGIYAIHCYCLDVLPESFAEKTVWLCVDCELEDAKPTSINLWLQQHGTDIEKTDTRRASKSCTVKSEGPKGELKKKKKKKKSYYKKQPANKSEKGKDSSPSGAESTLPQFGEEQSSEEIRQDDVIRKSCDDGKSSGNKPTSTETKSTPLCKNNAGAETGLGGDSCFEEAESEIIGTALVPIPEPLAIDIGTCSNEEVDALKSQRSFTASSDNTPQLESVHAQPIIEPIWRGNFRVGDGKSGFVLGLAAHLSSLAGSKVYEAAKQIPESLSPDLVPKSDVWPKAFEKSGPSDESIALYFFDASHRDENCSKDLITMMISQDLALRTVVQEAELLVFSSVVLPFQSWKFQGKLYLWGVFRKKQTSHGSNLNRSSPVSPLALCHSNASDC